ncbi:MAG: hypothetical protein ACLR0U_33130 [Enterocloster clostridioformis]
MAYTHALMITLDHMIFNNLFHEEIVPLSVGEKPLSRNLVTAHLEESMLTEESNVFHRICKSISGKIVTVQFLRLNYYVKC